MWVGSICACVKSPLLVGSRPFFSHGNHPGIWIQRKRELKSSASYWTTRIVLGALLQIPGPGMCLENSWDMGPTAQLAMWVLTASEAKGLQRPADLVRRRMQGVCGVRIRLCRYNPMDAITASSHSCPMLQWSWALDFPKLGFPGFC